MTNLVEIKPYIKDFVEDNLSTAFANKVYWIGERKNIPEYPYCMLSVIAENKDKRTSHHSGDLVEIWESGQSNAQILRQEITTRYKTCTITVGIYNAWVEDTYDTNDMDEEKEFAYEQIDLLEGTFENYPINNKFSIQSISPIRPLHEVVDGGYMYRYEFDLTIGYNEAVVVNKKYGNGLNLELVDTNEADTKIINGEVIINGDDYIDMNLQITIDNNDNIEIETT